MTEICNDWGVDDPAGVAMLTLSKPYNPNKAVDSILFGKEAGGEGVRGGVRYEVMRG